MHLGFYRAGSDGEFLSPPISQMDSKILLTELLALASVLPLPHVCDLGLDSYLNSLGTIRS